MIIVPFQPEHMGHLRMMNDSHRHTSITDIAYNTLPAIGYIAYMNGWPVAAGFLRRLEPCYAHFDTFITNANLPSDMRHESLNAIVDTLIEQAKSLNLKGVIATTSDEGILKRANELGWHIIPQVLIGKQVT